MVEIDSLRDFVMKGFFDELLVGSEYFDIDHILVGYYVYIAVSIAKLHSFAKKYFICYNRNIQIQNYVSLSFFSS